MNERRALVLIPCSSRKRMGSRVEDVSESLAGIGQLRNELLRQLRHTADLANRAANKRGILDPGSPKTSALEMYIGHFYSAAGRVLLELSLGKHAAVDLLIVSAVYGLLRPLEEVAEYDLTMGDVLDNGLKIYRFWQTCQLWRVLDAYVVGNRITHIWSLLPDSHPHVPYHRVFNGIWRTLRDSQIQAFHVQVPGVSRMTGRKRAEWLVEVLSTDHDSLLEMPSPPSQFPNIPGYAYHYERC